MEWIERFAEAERLLRKLSYEFAGTNRFAYRMIDHAREYVARELVLIGKEYFKEGTES
jgi:hypothetical protein